ncbi:hypothetical protein L1987_83398 [Smallanthus sonchifolius]|uniref:Uncharacterized protein n=1 Tax=Smallanthus sonchifolius TaxID=185202 RepID=A0ACB8YD72_9ASTR|nr:hypothetical protein L1987_83398 [Smallanthus sonchifolius]
MAGRIKSVRGKLYNNLSADKSVKDWSLFLSKLAFFSFTGLNKVQEIPPYSVGLLQQHDWLMTSPGTPLFPLLEMGSQKTIMNQNGTHEGHLSTLSNTQQESTLQEPVDHHP